DLSHALVHEISSGNCSNKPGWVRMSIHPTMTNQDMIFVCESIKDIATNYEFYLEAYNFSPATGKITRKDENGISDRMVESWFEI
ncbi:MAG: selenocysteine lyase, partial [Fluviicola sp.]